MKISINGINYIASGNLKLTMEETSIPPIDGITPPVIKEPVVVNPQPAPVTLNPISDGTRRVYEEDLAEEREHSTPNNIIIPRGISSVLDMTYKGSFRVEAKGEGGSTSNYAVGALGFNKDRNSIFMAGHAQRQCVAEFKIPETLSMSDSAKEVGLATVLQGYVQIANKKTQGHSTNRINGILSYGDNLLVTSEIFYDGNGRNEDNLQVFDDSSNLANSTYKGMLSLMGNAKSAGYMCELPDDMKVKFAADFMCGWSTVYSIVSRYSQGPSLYTFDPDDAFSSDTSVSTNPHMLYPFSANNEKGLVKNSNDTSPNSDPMWSTLSKVRYAFIVPNARILVCLGSCGGIHSGTMYKKTQIGQSKPVGGYASWDKNDNYNYFWLYDVDDILNATDTYEPRPFSYGKLSLPFDNKGRNQLIGATYNQDNHMLYISIANGGRTGAYDRPPMIVAYKLTIKNK